MVALYSVTPGRRWSVVHSHTGMQVAIVKGKRAKARMEALIAETDFTGLTWQECAATLAAAKRNTQRS